MIIQMVKFKPNFLWSAILTFLSVLSLCTEPHPRHHRYHSHVQRPYHSQEETPVAYLPILSLSLVISFFLIINCYKKESSPHIPDLTETSRLSSFFSRTCKGHQSFLLTKATTATLPTTGLPLINSSKAEGNNVETNSDNNNTRVKHFEANFEVKKLTSSLAGDCEANSICPQNVYMNENECQYEQVQNEIDPSQRVLQSTRHYQPQSLLPCQYQHDYHCYQQCQPRYLANCESESTVKSPSSRLTSSLSEPSLSTHKAMESSASPLEATPSNDNHHHKRYSTSEIFINFCSKMDSLHSDSPPLAPAISSKSFWSESVKTKCSSTCLSDRSIINDSDLDSNNNNNINSCNVDNNFINSSNRKMTNITRNPVCLGYKINEKFINCVDESFFERESTHSSGPSSPTSLSSSLTSSNSLVPNSSSSPSFSYGQTNNIFSKQSDHLKPRITYFDSIVVYRSDSGDISDFISSFVSWCWEWWWWWYNHEKEARKQKREREKEKSNFPFFHKYIY